MRRDRAGAIYNAVVTPWFRIRTALALFAACLAASASAQPATPTSAKEAVPSPPSVLFRNVRVFDGKAAALSAPTDVLVTGNLIKHIGREAIQPERG